VINSSADPDDHLRCFFTVKQLMDLRPLPSVPKLTEADQSRVLTDVLQAVGKASDKELTLEQKQVFVEILANKVDGQLVGKTPGEALATIMGILYEITAPTPGIYQDATDCDTLLKALPQYGANPSAQDNAKTHQKSWCKINDPMSTLNMLASVVNADDPTLANKLVVSSAGASGKTTVNNSVASSARDSLNKFVAPKDIGCAYQVLSWNESRLLFGRSVADDFIAVQVTVRNRKW
jgi:hypothetical protein